MSKAVLYIFAISHYCEKARWALDYLGVDYDLRCVAPGLHRKIAEKLGAARSSVPILVVAGQVIQGSDKIIDWADARSGRQQAAAAGRSLTPKNAEEDCRQLEQRMGDVTGVQVRRYYYSEALIEHPETVRPILARDVPLWHRLFLSWKWRLIRSLMIKGMDLGPAQYEESKIMIEQELGWLEARLSDGRKFLVADRFSRADIAAASLLAPLVTPKEHPTYKGLAQPPRLAAQVAGWQDRPSFRWVRQIYERYR